MTSENEDNFEVELLRPAIELILKTADRSTVTAKGVRKQLQGIYPAMDIKAHKASIDKVTYSVFNQEGSEAEAEDPDGGDDDDDEGEEEEEEEETKPSPSTSTLNGHHPSSYPQSSPAVTISKNKVVPPKKVKKEQLTDQQLAMRLQAELNSRPSRGSGGRKKASTTTSSATSKKKNTKSKTRVDSDDDDSLVEPVKKKRKVNPNSGFNKLHQLSQPMTDICGNDQLSRPGVVKGIWKYIKGNDLQLPEKKTEIRLDEKLKKIFPGTTVNSFTMAKYIGAHLFPLAPEDARPIPEIESDDEEEKPRNGA